MQILILYIFAGCNKLPASIKEKEAHSPKKLWVSSTRDLTVEG